MLPPRPSALSPISAVRGFDNGCAIISAISSSHDGRCGALAKVVEAAVDPELGQLFLGAVPHQAAVQGRETDLVHLLILVEAGEDDRLGAGHRIAMPLQALRADLFHDALHRRVDRGDRAVVRPEITLQARPARLGDRVRPPCPRPRFEPWLA